MIVYDGLKTDFLEGIENDRIATEIQQRILEKMGRNTPLSEFRSWENSLTHMYKVLTDEKIPNDAGIAIEYNIPQTAKRVDFMISGYDERKNPQMVIIELKQWERLNKVDSTDALVETFVGGSERAVVHPSYQAWSYAQVIRDYNSAVQDETVDLHPCAYLHNYLRKEKDPIDDANYEEYTEQAPAFTMGQVSDLRSFIKNYVKTGDRMQVLYLIDHGRIRPSKSLQDTIASMMNGNREFVMIDEQKVAYDKILNYAEQCQKDKKKRTIICQGGPGTGKSVIAINLLVELTKRGQFIQYVSKNSAPRAVYEEKLAGLRKALVHQMFKGSGSYTELENGIVNTLLVDEAHRLVEKSGIYHNQGENQIKELIHSSMCSVFFIDESQRVTLQDIGSVQEIEKWAQVEHSEVFYMELTSQFRCNGSNGYLAFLDDLLGIRNTANITADDLEYDIRVCDTPNQVQEMIIERNRDTNRARILAGYCWNWPMRTRNDTTVHDIQIGDFGISWNLNNGEAYASDPNSVNEAGCIHTTQGLEFDYVGVIIGDDMRYEDGHIITDFTKRAKTDKSLNGIVKLHQENPEEAKARADEIIKNTYRTLMTRGMKGCYIYCTDPGLQEYIRNRISGS